MTQIAFVKIRANLWMEAISKLEHFDDSFEITS